VKGRARAPAPAVGVVVVQRMVDVIEHSFGERMTLSTVSAAVRGRPVELGRLFRTLIGMSVHEYVTRVRLEHAAHLMASPARVQAIALRVGYRSKKNFYRQFLRQFGVTPDAYRRRLPQHGRAAAGNGATPDGTVYSGLFNKTPCLIRVEARPNIKGPASYVATPLVVVNHGVQPFASASEHVEIEGATEADALNRAATFLEHRFGRRAAAPKCRHDARRALATSRPRR
jgi:AraC-like DNA-binding protein